uniref:CCHC-type domain-containing protein n=1 Tax=Acrobeloides nanus TaxID=290746 RepID=A0A914DMH5_9BILA
MNKRPPNDFSGSSYQSRPSESPTCKRAKVVLSPNARRHRSRTPENVSSPCKILQVVKVEAMGNDEQQEQIPESSGLNAQIKVKEEENEHEKEKFEERINSRNEETQTEKAPSVPTVDTPFGSFKLYDPPNPESFILEPKTGYYYDNYTGFFYDKATKYYYAPKIKEWMFWTKTFRTYIPCKGGDEELKRTIQEQELVEAMMEEEAKNPKDDVITLDDEDEVDVVITSQPSTSTVYKILESTMPTHPRTENVKTIPLQPTAKAPPKKSPKVDSPVKVFIFELPTYMEKVKLTKIIQAQSYNPLEVKVDRTILTEGTVKTQGIVTFSNLSKATTWVRENQGVLKFEDGTICKLSFTEEKYASEKKKLASQPKLIPLDPKANKNPRSPQKAMVPMTSELENRQTRSESESPKGWVCLKCAKPNPKDKESCFYCHTHKDFLTIHKNSTSSASSETSSVEENTRKSPVLPEMDKKKEKKKMVNWTCAKCDHVNNPSRLTCLKSNTPKSVSEHLTKKGHHLIGSGTCDTILIRDLPINVDEACIRAALTQYTNTDFISLRMKKIELAGSRRYCLVQMKSLFDAVELFGKLEKISPMINNCKVIINYSRTALDELTEQQLEILRDEEPFVSPTKAAIEQTLQNLGYKSALQTLATSSSEPMVMSTSSFMYSTPMTSTSIQVNAQTSTFMGQNMVYSTLQPQMTTMPPQNSSMGLPPMFQTLPVPNLPLVPTPFGIFQSYPLPNAQNFRLEPAYNIYIDAITGFYYDSAKNHYYNPVTEQWTFWSSTYNCYIPVAGGNIFQKKQLEEQEKQHFQLYLQNFSNYSSGMASVGSSLVPPPPPPPQHTMVQSLVPPPPQPPILSPLDVSASLNSRTGSSLPTMPVVVIPQIDQHIHPKRLCQTLQEVMKVAQDQKDYISTTLACSNRLNLEEKNILSHFIAQLQQLRRYINIERDKIPPHAVFASTTFKNLANDVFRSIMEQNEYFKNILKGRIVDREAMVLQEMEQSILRYGASLTIPPVMPFGAHASNEDIIQNNNALNLLEAAAKAQIEAKNIIEAKKSKLPEKPVISPNLMQISHKGSKSNKKSATTKPSTSSKSSKKKKSSNSKHSGTLTKEEYLKEITGEDPLSRRLKKIASDGKITKDHLRVCTRCSQLGHTSKFCDNQHTATTALVNKVLKLAEIYRRYHNVGKKEQELEEGEVRSEGEKSTTSTGESVVEIASTKTKESKITHAPKNPLEPLITQLNKIAPNDKITMKHLQLCVNCGKVGHLGYSCPHVWKEVEMKKLQEMVKLIDQYKKEFKIKDDEVDKHKLGNLLRAPKYPEPVINGKDPLSLQITRLEFQHRQLTTTLWKDSIKNASNIETDSKIKEALQTLIKMNNISMKKEKFFNIVKNSLKNTSATFAQRLWNRIEKWFEILCGQKKISPIFKAIEAISHFCTNCAQIGHKSNTCNAPIYARANEEDITLMKELLKLYEEKLYIKQLRSKAFETSESSSSSSSRSHSPAHVEKVSIKKKKSPRKMPHALNGNNPLCEQLKKLAPNGKVKRSHLVLCMNCAKIGHLSSSCDAPENFLDKQLEVKLKEMTSLIRNYVSRIKNGELPSFYSDDENTYVDDEFIEISSESDDMTNLFEVMGPLDEDPFEAQLKELAPHGNITEKHLKLCVKCAKIGHLEENCPMKSKIWFTHASREKIEKMQKLIKE